MDVKELPHGLRHVLIHVTFGDFPPAENSAADIALLQAAKHARLRKAQGSEDVFLFVVVGNQPWQPVSDALSAYGFPMATAVCIEEEDVERRLEMGEEVIPGMVGNAVEQWMNLHHPGAVAAFPQEYVGLDFWWSGVEHHDDVFDWPFDATAFSKELPARFRNQAATWLTILGYAVDLHAAEASSPYDLGRDIAAAWAATLCEWLHGFEGACGNGYNDFGLEASSGVMPSAFYLGFELARLSGDDCESACDSVGGDIGDLPAVALKAITQDKRDDLRAALSAFFGGEAALYWALHSAIWPSYSDDFPRPMREALDRELGSDDHDDLARLDAPWRFVTEGWCDEADE